MAIHPPHDPDEALADQIEMMKFLKEKEDYKFVNYYDGEILQVIPASNTMAKNKENTSGIRIIIKEFF